MASPYPSKVLRTNRVGFYFIIHAIEETKRTSNSYLPNGQYNTTTLAAKVVQRTNGSCEKTNEQK